MREILDILGRQIEVGDIVLRPIFSQLIKSYVLGITPTGMYFSCEKVESTRTTNWQTRETVPYFYTNTTGNIANHNMKQYVRYVQDMYILEKNAVIPENLKQFIKY